MERMENHNLGSPALPVFALTAKHGEAGWFRTFGNAAEHQRDISKEIRPLLRLLGSEELPMRRTAISISALLRAVELSGHMEGKTLPLQSEIPRN